MHASVWEKSHIIHQILVKQLKEISYSAELYSIGLEVYRTSCINNNITTDTVYDIIVVEEKIQGHAVYLSHDAGIPSDVTKKIIAETTNRGNVYDVSFLV